MCALATIRKMGTSQTAVPRAVELLRQGRDRELWQMCCGFLSLDLPGFMAVQNRLMLEQIKALRASPLGRKLFRGAYPETVDEFRTEVPLTDYTAYCPELEQQREDFLPAPTASWVHTSGRSGEYACKWVPISEAYLHELSLIMYGVGILSCCRGWGDVSRVSADPRIAYMVAPRPYMSGTLADIIREQTPVDFLPSLEESEALGFEERVKLGFGQALSQGLDYFFGLSLVLVAVGEKFRESSGKVDIRPLLNQPGALFRLGRGLVRSRLAGRALLPRDIWSVRGIMCGGLDSSIYRDKIKELWGRYPLDVYASTEGSIIATQTWDYGGMTFVPNLNFLEFIPEREHFKWQLDHSYQPHTVLLDGVETGEVYELVISNFHGGSLVRYRIGDMVRITSLRNDNLGIETPQMVFERRADDLLDFVVIRLSEKTVWQAIEATGIPYVDWTANKTPGAPVLNIYIELKDGVPANEPEIARAIQTRIMTAETDEYSTSNAHDDLADMIKFQVKVRLLPRGAFAAYRTRRQAEGADLAHLKPPHINPPPKILSLLMGLSGEPAREPIAA